MPRKFRRKLSQKRFFRPLVEALEDRRLLAAVITVNSTADSNARDAVLTLREAILINNRTLAVSTLSAAEKALVSGTPTSGDSDTMQFNILADDVGHVYYKNNNVAGVSLNKVTATTATDDATISDIDPDWPHSWFSIVPTTPLPLINDAAIIDGYTQGSATPAIAGDDAVANTNLAGQGLNGVLKIEVSGASAGQVESGLIGITGAGGTTVRGLVLNRSAGPKVLFESTAANNRIEGNLIGPDVSGSLAFVTPFPTPLPGFLRSNGVFAQSGGNTIGGTTAESRNLISGNSFATGSLDGGIALRGFGAPSLIRGNLIGTDRLGTKALGNMGYGILVDSPNNIIGGQFAGNVISANQGGINASNGNNTGGTILCNWIGTDVSGTLDLGNAGDGILFGNFAGGNQATLNTIAFNSTGVKLGSASQIVSRNSIFSNDGLGIVGPQTDPALLSVSAIGGGTRITGTLAGTANGFFRLEFFANPERDEFVPAGTFITPGQLGEGQTFIGEMVVTVPAGGTATFSVDFPVDLLALPGPGGQPFVTATATDITDSGSGPTNKTSEFSHVAALGGPSFVVTNTGDSGLGTLREAIINANLTAGAQTITFAIPAGDPRHFYYQDDGVDGEVSLVNIVATTAATDATLPTSGASAVDPDWPHSWFSIRPSHTLPDIIDTITIEGYSQAGSSTNSLPALGPLDTLLKIELNGENATGDGLHLTFGGDVGVNFTDAAHSTIRGLAINRFGGDGVELDTLDGGNTIAGSFIGTDVSGTLDLGNNGNGISIVIEDDTTIGGSTQDSRNLISGNSSDGVELIQCQASVIEGDLIGLNRSLTEVLDNDQRAVFFHSVPAISDNAGVIGAKATDRVSANATANESKANRVQRVMAQAGDLEAILMDLDDPFKAFIVIFSVFELFVRPHETSLSSPNVQDSFEEVNAVNQTLAIDLGDDGVTLNDTGDADSGPNGLQNFPVLTAAPNSATGTFITGALNSLANASFRVELYSNTVGPNFRAGERYLGFVDVTTNAQGNAAFVFTSPIFVPIGQFIAATATRLANLDNNAATPLEPVETSEFSDVIAVRDNPWHNQAEPLDVTDDGHVAAGDALEIINRINGFGSRRVPWTAELGVPGYYDTDNDLFVAPNDALDVINTINSGLAGEGEGNAEAAALAREIDGLIVMLAADAAASGRRRRGSS